MCHLQFSLSVRRYDTQTNPYPCPCTRLGVYLIDFNIDNKGYKAKGLIIAVQAQRALIAKMFKFRSF